MTVRSRCSAAVPDMRLQCASDVLADVGADHRHRKHQAPTARATLTASAGHTSHRRRSGARLATSLHTERACRSQRRVQPGKVVRTARGGDEEHVKTTNVTPMNR